VWVKWEPKKKEDKNIYAIHRKMRKGDMQMNQARRLGCGKRESGVHNRRETGEDKPIPGTAVCRIITCHLGWRRWAGKSGKYEGRKEGSIVSATSSATSSETGQLTINTGKKKSWRNM
jgi:hypothetical protein